MILITGGLGFIGLNTAAALLDMGEQCVLTQHRAAAVPEKFKGEVGSRLFIEQVEMTDAENFLALGDKYPITGIIHLAVHWNPSTGSSVKALFENTEINLQGLANVLQAAQTWKAKRVLIASTHNVYGEETGKVWREDQAVDLTGADPVMAIKKSTEILANFLAGQSGVECVILRFGNIFGPLNHWPSMPTTLTHAAVEGKKPDLGFIMGGTSAGEGNDTCYIKDAARAIALLQLSPSLNHRVYNVGAGRPTKNEDIVAAIKEVIPEAQLELPSADGKDVGKPSYLDISRLVQDTGFQPQYTTGQAFAEYIAWLREDNKL